MSAKKPPGEKFTKVLSTVIPPDLDKRVRALAARENKTPAALLREALEKLMNTKGKRN